MRLQPGDTAPEFTLVDDTGSERSLTALLPTVVYFYPRAFTPGCTTQACDFRDGYHHLQAVGYDVVGISPDPPERLAAFREEHRLPFPLLSDLDRTVAMRYGAWGTKKLYGKEVEGLIRSTIVIGADGKVEHAWYNVRATGHGDRVGAALG